MGDLNVPIDFTGETEGDLVQGVIAMVGLDAESIIELPLEATASVLADSDTVYDVVSGGSGTQLIVLPEQTVMTTGNEAPFTLVIDGGNGNIDVTPDADATELQIRLTEAIFNLMVDMPVPLPLTLDASATGGCTMTGDGLFIPVTGAGGAGCAGGTGGSAN